MFSFRIYFQIIYSFQYFCNFITSEHIGVENKVNYIYRPKGHLDRNEIVGLCALLNSTLFDSFFRIFNGNVNVSATELREIPLPEIETIKSWLTGPNSANVSVVPYQVGERIKVASGPFSNQEAIVQEVSKTHYVLVLESLGCVLKMNIKGSNNSIESI